MSNYFERREEKIAFQQHKTEIINHLEMLEDYVEENRMDNAFLVYLQDAVKLIESCSTDDDDLDYAQAELVFD